MTDNDSKCIDFIKTYWDERGYSVECYMTTVTQIKKTGGSYSYSFIVSDMINGLPRGYTGDLAPEAVQTQAGRGKVSRG